MSRLKTQKIAPKVIAKNQPQPQGGACDQRPSVSFLHLTTNKHFTLSYFKDPAELQKATANLYSRIEEITKETWTHWLSLRKTTGAEILEFSRISFSPNDISITGDESIYIFRITTIDNRKGRILGFRKEKCPIYFIIGFDFDYSAYDHG